MQKHIVALKKSVTNLEKRVKKLEDMAFPALRDDGLFESAKNLVREYEFASASLLQRRLSIGYARSAGILDQLTEKGVIRYADGAKPRKVIR
ncbi:MAG: DNA translocase FtsK [Candidatus Gottesmanbacteria bacterium]|nr:DNA translocase FtsK [Candidatus Gottesmanbacteria bacterium]